MKCHFSTFWLEFRQLSLAALLILGWSGALIGLYMRPWQIKMNDYLINGIGLSDTAFWSVAPRSSKKPNKKDSWWHRGGELSGFSGPALAEAHLPGNRKQWLWNPCHLRMSLKFDVGQSPIPNENDRVPRYVANLRSQSAGGVGQCLRHLHHYRTSEDYHGTSTTGHRIPGPVACPLTSAATCESSYLLNPEVYIAALRSQGRDAPV